MELSFLPSVTHQQDNDLPPMPALMNTTMRNKGLAASGNLPLRFQNQVFTEGLLEAQDGKRPAWSSWLCSAGSEFT